MVAVLYKAYLSPYIERVDVYDECLICMDLRQGTKHPKTHKLTSTLYGTNYDLCLDYFGKINYLMDQHNNQCYVLCVSNAHQPSVFGQELQLFCVENGLRIVDVG